MTCLYCKKELKRWPNVIEMLRKFTINSSLRRISKILPLSSEIIYPKIKHKAQEIVVFPVFQKRFWNKMASLLLINFWMVISNYFGSVLLSEVCNWFFSWMFLMINGKFTESWIAMKLDWIYVSISWYFTIIRRIPHRA